MGCHTKFDWILRITIFSAALDRNFKLKYRPKAKPAVMGSCNEVECIVAKRIHGVKGRVFFIRRKNYSAADNTWEPEELVYFL